MKKYFVSLLFVACTFAITGFAQTFNLSAVNGWVGSGSNEAALVIDWHDGNTPSSLVWGYRWDGTASVSDMVQAIDSADPRLLITDHPLFANAVYSIFYDLTGNGGTPTMGLPFDMGGMENGSAPFSGDHYKEGWVTGFWGLLNGNGNPYNGGGWEESNEGSSTDMLGNNGFYALSFARDTISFQIAAAGVPVAAFLVPEPACGRLLALCVGCGIAWRLGGRRLRRRSA